MIRTASSIDLSCVTPADIGRAHKVFGPDNQPFYLVQSSRDPIVEYKVTWHPRRGFQCRCPAGQEAFVHCRDVCQHVKIALAAAREEREALAELHVVAICAAPQAKQQAHPTGLHLDAETLARIAAASERAASRPPSRARVRDSKPFSLLR
jgi:hypothetical protein